MLTEGILLLNKKYAADYFSKVEAFTSPAYAGRIDDFLEQHFESKIAATKDIYTFDGVNAHIQINGPMSPGGPDLYDIFFGYGGVSFADILGAIQAAKEDVNPATGKVFFHMNTPGSTVDGVDSTFQAIAELSEGYHTIAINHGMIASGGMWIASAMREIQASTPVAFTGSIGVIIAGYDLTEMFEKMGVKRVVITNHEATEKAPDISTTEGQAVIRQELNDIYQVFKDRVLSGREKMSSSAVDNLKGGVRVASEALKIGLIDSITGTNIKSAKNKSESPAAAGQPKEEAVIMKLQELLAVDPEAKAEFDAAIQAATDDGFAKGEVAGKDAGKAAMVATMDAALPILASDKYPTTVKDRVTAKMKAGDVEGLQDFVALHDMNAEAAASTAAAGEGAEETPPIPPEASESQASFEAKKKRTQGV